MRNLILFALALTALYSCENTNMDPILEGETGILAIKMATKDIPPEVVQVKGELTKPDNKSIFFDFEMGENQALARVEGIPVGKWTVRVDAYSSESEVIYSGSASVEITAGKSTTVQLTLTATGSLDIVVVWGSEAQLVAYYPFNGNAHDESGNGNHGEVMGAKLTSDRFENTDRAYYFDGIDDVVSLDPHVLQGKSISISAWVKKMGDGPDEWNSVVAGDCSTPYFGFLGNAPTFGGQCGSPMDHQFGEYELSDTLWHHMVGIYNGSHILLYFDNQLLVNEYVGNFEFDNSIPVGIGGSYLHWRDPEGFMGMIDDVRIYYGELTAKEVESLYRDNVQILPLEGLIAYYPFNGNAFDESGNDYHGKVMGATLINDRFGNANSAFYFDGIENEIFLEDQSSLDISGDISICVWFKTEIPQWGSLVSNFDQHMPDNGYELCVGSLYDDGGFVYVEFTKDDLKDRLSTNSLYNDGKWHLVVATLSPDGTSRRRVFVDAIEQFGYDGPGGPISSIGPTPNYPFKIGAASNKAGPEGRANFKGAIDDVRIYERVLNQEEITSLYRYGGWDE